MPDKRKSFIDYYVEQLEDTKNKEYSHKYPDKQRHIVADKILCEVLHNLKLSRIANKFNEINKNY